jgi:hypothetical protein
MAIDIEQIKKCETAQSQIEADWKSNGFRCVVIFVRQSHRCGYVRIPKRHIAFIVGSYDDLPIAVHGGLTFGGQIDILEKDANYIWFGFDCGHSGDRESYETEGHFWTTSEVIEETNKMARQFKEMTREKVVDYKMKYMPDWFKNQIKIKK